VSSKKLRRIFDSGAAPLLAAVALFVTEEAFAANNPLDTIMAANYDTKSGMIKTESSSEGGNDICSIHNGDFVVYKDCDFDSGVAAFKARIASIRKGSIEIRLDSPAGRLMGVCPFDNSGGWQEWEDVRCKVDNSQAGPRDVYLVFHGQGTGALVNVRSFVFLKSIVMNPSEVPLGFPDRVDVVDDEPQGTNSWGMPEAGFTDDFEHGDLSNWIAKGISITTNAVEGGYSAESLGTDFNFAFTPNAYINKTDTGGEWRTLAEASLTADMVIDSPAARPGIGFSSKDARQQIFVILNSVSNSIEAWRKLSDGSLFEVKQYSDTNTFGTKWTIQPGVKYRLKIDWSPYSDGLIVFLQDEQGNTITSFRTVIDLPAARRPLLVCSGGPARFDNVKFDPTLDSWDFKWQWKKEPILAPDVCNPAIWKWKDGKYYMMWRKFGADNYHGIITSTDGVAWSRVKDDVLKCTGDMNVVVNPFGDGLVYITPGGDHMPWWTSDGSNQFTAWKKTRLNLGNIYGNCRIQEIIDTKHYPQMTPVTFEGNKYQFIAFTEDWNRFPKPHTVVLLGNTLTNWVVDNPNPVIPPGTNFWGEKGSAIGSAIVLPDGNILIADCACTFAGYTGAPEPSNVSVIVDGKQPWKVLKLGVLPDAPVSREHVWYEGPNFGTALYYESANDTLYFYGGFHDYYIGMMRVQNFMQSKLFK
jgi:Carbohydrate binding module (family 6)